MDIQTKEDYWRLAEETLPNILKMAQRVGILDTANIPQLIKDKNVNKLNHILNYIWFRLPNSPSTREISGFFDLCDLCSEIWVFDEMTGDSQ